MVAGSGCDRALGSVWEETFRIGLGSVRKVVEMMWVGIRRKQAYVALSAGVSALC